jgi:hypothetical protein
VCGRCANRRFLELPICPRPPRRRRSPRAGGESRDGVSRSRSDATAGSDLDALTASWTLVRRGRRHPPAPLLCAGMCSVDLRPGSGVGPARADRGLPQGRKSAPVPARGAAQRCRLDIQLRLDSAPLRSLHPEAIRQAEGAASGRADQCPILGVERERRCSVRRPQTR